MPQGIFESSLDRRDKVSSLILRSSAITLLFPSIAFFIPSILSIFLGRFFFVSSSIFCFTPLLEEFNHSLGSSSSSSSSSPSCPFSINRFFSEKKMIANQSSNYSIKTNRMSLAEREREKGQTIVFFSGLRQKLIKRI
ncbi:hypothetical protein SSS_10831 [Sarcoptes scabiei]|nr:hypothetical protein SSS_10831 [Sarcoptes scabiei]